MPRKRLPWKRKKAVRWRWVLGGVGLAVLVAAAGVAISVFGGGNKLRTALTMGRLAHVPEHASNVKVERVGNLLSSTYLARFAASGPEIDAFVAASPSLRQLIAEPLGPERMYVAASQASADASAASRDVYFQPDERYPWFDPNVRVKGRRFVIPRDKEGCAGEVVIDDECHIVYIKVWRG